MRPLRQAVFLGGAVKRTSTGNLDWAPVTGRRVRCKSDPSTLPDGGNPGRW